MNCITKLLYLWIWVQNVFVDINKFFLKKKKNWTWAVTIRLLCSASTVFYLWTTSPCCWEYTGIEPAPDRATITPIFPVGICGSRTRTACASIAPIFRVGACTGNRTLVSCLENSHLTIRSYTLWLFLSLLRIELRSPALKAVVVTIEL